MTMQLHMLLVYIYVSFICIACKPHCMFVLLQETRVDKHDDGSCKSESHFNCKDGHAVFVALAGLLPDRWHRKGHSSGDSKSCNCALHAAYACIV